MCVCVRRGVKERETDRKRQTYRERQTDRLTEVPDRGIVWQRETYAYREREREFLSSVDGIHFSSTGYHCFDHGCVRKQSVLWRHGEMIVGSTGDGNSSRKA